MLKWAHKGATFLINIEDLGTHKENEDLIVIALVNSEVGPELKSNPFEMQRDPPRRRPDRRDDGLFVSEERSVIWKTRCDAALRFMMFCPPMANSQTRRETSHSSAVVVAVRMVPSRS